MSTSPVAGSTTAPAHADSRPKEAVLRRDGEYWTVAFAGPAFRLRHSLGLGYLARLVADPDREFHVLDIMVRTSGVPDEVAARAALREDAGPILDETAKSAYRHRLEDLAVELEEAERWSDQGRADRARVEIDALTDQLAAAVGLGGRGRRMGSETERVRVNVTKAIRSAIRHIAKQDAQLGQHLDHSVRTGTYCSYAPDAAAQVRWVT